MIFWQIGQARPSDRPTHQTVESTHNARYLFFRAAVIDPTGLKAESTKYISLKGKKRDLLRSAENIIDAISRRSEGVRSRRSSLDTL